MATTDQLQIADPRRKVTLTIASGVACSTAINTRGYRLAGIGISSGWDTANRLTFRVSPDGSSYADLYDTAGNPYQIASGTPLVSATHRAMVLDVDTSIALMTYPFLKLQSGPSTAAANLTTGVTFDLMLIPL